MSLEYLGYLRLYPTPGTYGCFLQSPRNLHLILLKFLDRFGHRNGGSIRSDQGGELARSFAYSDLLLRKHKYVVEPTGADSPSQNGSVEIYNAKLAVHTRTLLFGSGLPAKYWSSVLVHVVYLHNRLVHTIVASILLHFATRPIHVYWPSGKMQQNASYDKSVFSLGFFPVVGTPHA